MASRKPGLRAGVRRYQRYGQQTLDVGKTLDPRFQLCERNVLSGSKGCWCAEEGVPCRNKQ